VNQDIVVQAQDTPNPLAIKFIVSKALKSEGKATFQAAEECREIPMAEALMLIKGVKQVYFFENTVTVTFDDEIATDDLKNCVEAVIKTRMPVHNANFVGPEDSKATKSSQKATHDDPTMNLIEEILDRTIRPGLQADGGDIELIEFTNNELKILYQGACGGCPSAMMGTLDAIQNILRHELDSEDLVVYPI